MGIFIDYALQLLWMKHYPLPFFAFTVIHNNTHTYIYRILHLDIFLFTTVDVHYCLFILHFVLVLLIPSAGH